MLLIPLATFAQGASAGQTLQEQITALLQQIATLQAQVAALQNSNTTHITTPTPQPPPPPPDLPPPPPLPPVTFDRDLFFGMRNNPEVSGLQQFLIDQ